MDANCRANKPSAIKVTTSKSMNHSAWEGHANEKKFTEALANFMIQSWTVVCQVREKSGLSPQYEMSPSEIAKRIDDVSKRLECKYKEVEALEAKKALLLNKSSGGGSKPVTPSSSSSQYMGQYGRGTSPSASKRQMQGPSGAPCRSNYLDR